MGNAQPINEPTLISRPYHAACKNITETLPIATVLSYQSPESPRIATDDGCTTRSKGRGCCLSSTSGPFDLRRDSLLEDVEHLKSLPEEKNDETIEYGDVHGMYGDENKNGVRGRHHPHCETYRDDSLATSSLINIPVFGQVTNHKPFLEPQIIGHFLPFILDGSLASCLRTCPHWLQTIYSYLKLQCRPLLHSFQRTYCHQHLEYECSGINIQPIFTTELTAVRIDLLIYCKVSE